MPALKWIFETGINPVLRVFQSISGLGMTQPHVLQYNDLIKPFDNIVCT